MRRSLFEMSDAALDHAVQAHYDRMYDQHYGQDEPEPCCKLCRHFSSAWKDYPSCCTCDENNDDDAEEYKQTKEDNYCEHFEWEEDDYPDWMDGDDE